MKRTLITNVCIVDGGEHKSGGILIADHMIEAILPSGVTIEDAQTIDGHGYYASSGFIELHCHGGNGYDFMDCTQEAYLGICEMQLAHGVTTLLPTTATDSDHAIRNTIDAFRQTRQTMQTRQFLPGIHIEGQYISSARNGGMFEKYIKNPDSDEYSALIAYADGDIARWSAAPELEGGMLFGDYCKDHGIVASIAHSDATYDDVVLAMQHGYTHLTHFYSDMNTIVRKNGFRVMGAIEAAYDLDDLWIEVIADGCHIPPALMNYIYRHIGADRMHIVSDCIRPAGLEGPIVDVGTPGRKLEGLLEDGVVKFTDRSAFHGSIAQGDMLVQTMHCKCGLPLTDCIRMISENPAKIMHIENQKGRLLPGMDADIVLFDKSITTKQVYYRGMLVVSK
ncbi:MAG: amidohydrolase family protein [Clostridia bacterium]